MKGSYYSVILRSCIVITLLTCLILPNITSPAAAEQSMEALEMNEVYQLIQQFHVSGISEKKLSDKAIKAMVDALDDPYTRYLTKSEWQDFENALERNYVGIGVRLGMDDSGIYAAEIFKGSPAESADIQVGDYITAVEGKSTQGIYVEDLIARIVGEENTNVTITIKRNQVLLDKKMVRKRIMLPIVETHLFSEQTGYIRLSSFSNEADEQFAAKLSELRKSSIRSLIVDLRDNGGGLLETAQNIAKLFVKEGVLIHTDDRNHVDAPISFQGGSTVDFPVYILMNENSASASEVLSGALQDYKVATVIGTQSYGKGSVQQIYALSGGGRLKLTIEEYLTPLSRKVNKVGITPDIPVFGGVSQVLSALQIAGIHDITLTRDRNSLFINNQEFSADHFLIQTKDNQVYVPSRVLASMVEGKLTWDGETNSVEIVSDENKQVFPVSSEGMMMVNGKTYISLDLFSKKFPQLEWTSKNDRLTLHALKKGK